MGRLTSQSARPDDFLYNTHLFKKPLKARGEHASDWQQEEERFVLDEDEDQWPAAFWPGNGICVINKHPQAGLLLTQKEKLGISLTWTAVCVLRTRWDYSYLFLRVPTSVNLSFRINVCIPSSVDVFVLHAPRASRANIYNSRRARRFFKPLYCHTGVQRLHSSASGFLSCLYVALGALASHRGQRAKGGGVRDRLLDTGSAPI